MIKVKISDKRLLELPARMKQLNYSQMRSVMGTAGRAVVAPIRSKVARSMRKRGTGLLAKSIIIKMKTNKRGQNIGTYFAVGAESKKVKVTRTAIVPWRTAAAIKNRKPPKHQPVENFRIKRLGRNAGVEVTYTENANPARYFHLIDQGTVKAGGAKAMESAFNSDMERGVNNYLKGFEKAWLKVMQRKLKRSAK